MRSVENMVMIYYLPLKGEFTLKNIFIEKTSTQTQYCNTNNNNNRFRYDIKSNTWSEVAPMSTARQFSTAAVISGSIYVMGGCAEDRGECNLVECYLPKQNKWISIAPMNEIRYAVSAGVANGLLFVFGGAGKDNITSSIERYDPKEDKWTMVIIILGT